MHWIPNASEANYCESPVSTAKCFAAEANWLKILNTPSPQKKKSGCSQNFTLYFLQSRTHSIHMFTQISQFNIMFWTTVWLRIVFDQLQNTSSTTIINHREKNVVIQITLNSFSHWHKWCLAWFENKLFNKYLKDDKRFMLEMKK